LDDLPFGNKSTRFINTVEREANTIMMQKLRDDFSKGDSTEESEDQIEGTDLREAIKKLEKSTMVNYGTISALASKLRVDKSADEINEEILVLLSRTQCVEGMLGHRINSINPELNAPSLWGSIALLSSMYDKLAQDVVEIPTQGAEFKIKINSRTQEMDIQLQETLFQSIASATSRIDSLKKSVQAHTDSINAQKLTVLHLARGAVQLKDDIIEVMNAVENNCPGTSTEATPIATDDVTATTMQSDLSSLKTIIHTMISRIDNLSEGKDSKAIDFFGLTFRSHMDAESWVFENLEASYGLIVDAHLVMEHVFYHAFSEDGALKELNSLFKIKIDNLTQGLAMASFDTRMPKFFSVPAQSLNKKPKVKKPDSSHFENIDSYEDWDLPVMGFRSKLKDQFQEFEETHVRMIKELLAPDDPAYRVATMSVAASVGWLQKFVTYIDETYQNTVRQNSFSTARAWQFVSQLGRQILMEISLPRVGINKLFRVGNNKKIAQVMFWPMVQSHELMNRYKKAGFKDDPSIGSEYVKFIAVNSGSSDAVSQINTKLSTIESEVKDAVKSGKVALTSASTAANKADELKKLITDLSRRVEKLEKSNK
jgi:hypothetical protein